MIRIVVMMALLCAGLSACAAGSSAPAHNYIIFPADSPAVLHYQTNPYAGGDAPPYWPSPSTGFD